MTLAGDHLPQGHVGPPIPCNMMKVCDVPEMDYFAKDDKGEVSLCISTGDQLPQGNVGPLCLVIL